MKSPLKSISQPIARMYVQTLHRKKSICVFAVVEQGTLSIGTHLILPRRTNLKKTKKLKVLVKVQEIWDF